MGAIKNIRYCIINRSCHEPQEWRYDEWNCNLCGNDIEYYQPYNDTDFIYIQSWFEDVVSADPSYPTTGWWDGANDWYIRARIYDLSGTLITEDHTDFVERSGVGYIDNLSYQNIQINPNSQAMEGVDCFYVQFEVVKTAAVGSTPAVTEFYRTEPYKRVTCEPTFLIEGMFKGFDSECNYYDVTENHIPNSDIYNSQFSHRDRYRVIGGYENDSFSNTCAMTGDGTQTQIKTSTLKHNVYRLWTKGLPPYVADRIANSITGYEFWIDDCIGCLCLATLEKNNEKGNMWYIDTHIEQIASEVKHFNCE